MPTLVYDADSDRTVALDGTGRPSAISGRVAVWSYDLEADRWLAGTASPVLTRTRASAAVPNAPRYWFAAAYHDPSGLVVVYDGTRAWAYDVEADAWSAVRWEEDWVRPRGSSRRRSPTTQPRSPRRQHRRRGPRRGVRHRASNHDPRPGDREGCDLAPGPWLPLPMGRALRHRLRPDDRPGRLDRWANPLGGVGPGIGHLRCLGDALLRHRRAGCGQPRLVRGQPAGSGLTERSHRVPRSLSEAWPPSRPRPASGSGCSSPARVRRGADGGDGNVRGAGIPTRGTSAGRTRLVRSTERSQRRGDSDSPSIGSPA